MTDIRVIIREFSRGTSLREMERELKLSRTSLRNYRDRAEASGRSMVDLLALNDTELQAIMLKGDGQHGRDTDRYAFLQENVEDYAKDMTRKHMTYDVLYEEYLKSTDNPYVYSSSRRSFIERAENLLIDGRTGCGKSFLACAIGRQACFMGHRVEYFSMNKFIERIALAKLDGSILKVINHIEKNDLVFFDDFGLQPLDNNSRLALLQILEDCYQRKSVIVTSQLSVSKWYDYINEPTLTDAIMDCLTANAVRIELKGDSMRRKNQK